MSEPITIDQARAYLRRAVEEKGADYVDPNADAEDEMCEYFHDGRPSCIVGHVLHYHGVPASTVGWAVIHDSPGDLFASWIVREYLSEAQAVQDGGDTWGQALLCAEDRLSNLEAANESEAS